LTDTSEFWKALNAYVPPVIPEIEHRAYYNSDKVLYTLSNPVDAKWPAGDYIVITKQQDLEFRQAYNIVQDGKLVTRVPMDMNSCQLELAPDGNYISLPNNIIFVATHGDRYKLKDRFEEV
jgi:hypothetical protein